MDDRATLIERAAARLRNNDGIAVGKEAEGGTVPKTAAREHQSTALPARKIVLDRDHLGRAGVIMPWTAMSRVVDEFRIVKRNLMFPWQLPDYPKLPNRPPRVVMVTSSRPREGKTFCSINLALAFAAEEQLSTVLIDGDAVRGDVSRILQVPTEPGFTELLAGKYDLNDVLVQTDLPNLVVLPSGAHGPRIPELLANRTTQVFAEIAKNYPEHVIVLDTAPCLASTDPAALAPLVGQIVFVIEAEHTQKPEIESSLNLLSGAGQISFLLNKTSANSSRHFGSYSYYYHSDEDTGRAKTA